MSQKNKHFRLNVIILGANIRPLIKLSVCDNQNTKGTRSLRVFVMLEVVACGSVEFEVDESVFLFLH